MNITDLPVGECRRYETLECRSDVPYQGRVNELKAYWEYTDPRSLLNHEVDDIRCKIMGRCKNPEIGWQSSKGIYRDGNSYFWAVRLGRTKENAQLRNFTCHFEGDSGEPASVNIVTIIMRTVEREDIIIVTLILAIYFIVSHLYIPWPIS